MCILHGQPTNEVTSIIMKRILSSIILILTKVLLISGQSPESRYTNLEILVPTGEVVNDLYVLKKAPLNDTVASGALKVANNTFIGESFCYRLLLSLLQIELECN